GRNRRNLAAGPGREQIKQSLREQCAHTGYSNFPTARDRLRVSLVLCSGYWSSPSALRTESGGGTRLCSGGTPSHSLSRRICPSAAIRSRVPPLAEYGIVHEYRRDIYL